MTTATATPSEAFDPALLRTLRAAPWRTIERRFLFVLAASFAVHVCLAAYIAAQPAPKFEAYDEPVDRFLAQPKLPPLMKLPVIPNLPVKASAPTAARPAPSAPKSVGEQREVAKQAINQVFGGGAITSVLGAPGTDDVKTALNGVQGHQFFGAVGPTGPKGPATGETQTVEPIGTEGVKAVNIGARLDKLPLQTKTGPIEVERTDEIDPRKLQEFINARRPAMQGCFERALLHNGGLKGGKVSVRLMLGAKGRVTSLAIEEDSLGSAEVSGCMTTLMRRWIFPVDPSDELPVSVPFIFARAP
jgi:hypothetical protein